MFIKTPISKLPNGHHGHPVTPTFPLAAPVNLAGPAEENLDPAALAEIWSRRACALAEKPPTAVIGQTVDLLIFRLGSERYGIEVINVREIYPLEQLTPVPRTPNFVAGVFSARGRILSVVDLNAFWGLAATHYSSQTKIIVVTNTNPASETFQMELALLADQVDDVITIFQEEIAPPLTTHAGAHSDYVRGGTADLLVVLNLNALLSDKRLVVHQELL